MLEVEPIINYRYTSDWQKFSTWLQDLPHTIALDFETASCYTPEHIAEMERRAAESTDPYETIALEAAISSTALSHPSYVTITHLSLAWTEHDAIVFIVTDEAACERLMDWLVENNHQQIWHNFGYDGKLIHYWTREFPHNFEDSALLAKTLLNHVEVWRATTKLKYLMGYKYGSWAIDASEFTQDNLFDEKLLKYAATDACATLALWYEMQSVINKQEE